MASLLWTFTSLCYAFFYLPSDSFYTCGARSKTVTVVSIFSTTLAPLPHTSFFGPFFFRLAILSKNKGANRDYTLLRMYLIMYFLKYFTNISCEMFNNINYMVKLYLGKPWWVRLIIEQLINSYTKVFFAKYYFFCMMVISLYC